jgi:RimJ/RimL family protein N-acetyltransferase
MPENEHPMPLVNAVPPILRDLPEELVGERVVVRPYRPGDGLQVFEAIRESLAELRPWMPWATEGHTLQDAEAFARRSHAQWHLREELYVAVCARDTGRFLGSSGLHVIDWDVPWFEVGYWLRTSAVGKGYATESARLVLGLAFERLGANRVDLRCDTRNERSAAVARRLGFAFEGTRRNDSRDTAGHLRDTHLFAMTAEAYGCIRPEPGDPR